MVFSLFVWLSFGCFDTIQFDSVQFSSGLFCFVLHQCFLIFVSNEKNIHSGFSVDASIGLLVRRRPCAECFAVIWNVNISIFIFILCVGCLWLSQFVETVCDKIHFWFNILLLKDSPSIGFVITMFHRFFFPCIFMQCASNTVPDGLAFIILIFYYWLNWLVRKKNFIFVLIKRKHSYKWHSFHVNSFSVLLIFFFFDNERTDYVRITFGLIWLCEKGLKFPFESNVLRGESFFFVRAPKEANQFQIIR